MKQRPSPTNTSTQPDPRANVLMTSAGIMIQAPPCASLPGSASSTAAAATHGSKRR